MEPETLVPVVDYDLAAGLTPVHGLGASTLAHVLVRHQGVPLCRFEMPVISGAIDAIPLWLRAVAELERGDQPSVLSQVLGVTAARDAHGPPLLPTATIVIGTRERAADLDRCLASLAPLVGDDVEVIVIDNDPLSNATRDVCALYPVRYVRQARRGVNWARARGVQLARHDIVLFVDDDVVVDRAWADELRRPFLDPHVGAVTGAVEPLALGTVGQYAHERFSSFYRGFERRVHSLLTMPAAAAGHIGAGASMAVRRDLARAGRLFEAEIDGGTPGRSGGDALALYRILHDGHMVVYAPRALAWHRHRTSVRELERMLHGYSVGGYCVLLRALFVHRDLDALPVGIYWFGTYHLRELVRALVRARGARPLRLVCIEIAGALSAPLAYLRCRLRERALGPLSELAA
jgi:glycosyltransferase involved in cell wall biosynthesis